MDEDEIVETSDAEELEVICATKRHYWKGDPIVTTVGVRDNDDNSPRKRAKISHVRDRSLSFQSHSAGSTSPGFQSTPFPSSSPGHLIATSSQNSSSIIQTPAPLYTQECNLSPSCLDLSTGLYEENSQDPLLLCSQDARSPFSPASTRGASPIFTPTTALETDDPHKAQDPLHTPEKATYETRSCMLPLDAISPLDSPPCTPKHKTSLVNGENAIISWGNRGHPPNQSSPKSTYSHMLPSLSVVSTECPGMVTPQMLSSPLTAPPSIIVDDHLVVGERGIDSDSDDPFQLTPLKPALPHVLSSPLSPPLSEAGLSSLALSSASLGPSKASPPHLLPEDHSAFYVNEDANPTRYALRARQAKQLHPYAYDKLSYKQQMRSNPDAIVKIVSPSRGGHHDRRHAREFEGGGTQEQWLADGSDAEDANWEEESRAKKRGRSRSASASDENAGPTETGDGIVPVPAQHPVALQDLPSTDEEEKEVRALSKHARKIIQQRKAKEERANVKKARSFPLSKRFMSPKDICPAEEGLPVSDPDIYFGGPPSPHDSLPTPAANVDTAYDDRNMAVGEEFDWDQYSMDIPPNTRETAIIVGDDETSRSVHDGDEMTDASHGSSSVDHLEPKNAKERKRLRAYRRMVPAIMVNRHFGNRQEPPLSHRRSVTVERDSDIAVGPLLPGQTRVRKAEHLRDLRLIKGDTESSDDEPSDRADSTLSLSDHGDGTEVGIDHDTNVRVHHQQSRNFVTPHSLDVSDTSDDEESSTDNGLDDDEIRTYLGHGKGDTGRPRSDPQVHEESLIDWMLTRTSTIGVKKQPKQRKVRGGRRLAPRPVAHKFDVITRGAKKHGTERQTLLNFDRPSRSTKSRPNQKGYRPFPTTDLRRESVTDMDADDIDAPEASVYFKGRNPLTIARKQKKKERRRRAKGQGIYTFTANDTHVTSGRRKAITVSIDPADEEFHKALAPLSQDWTQPSDLPRSKVKPLLSVPPGQAPTTNTDHWKGGKHKNHIPRLDRRRDINRDFDIPSLPSGIAFSPTTYVGKGWLHELVNLVSGVTQASTPAVYTACGFELGPTVGVPRLLTLLEEICHRLFEVATSLPEDDSAEQVMQWGKVMRVVCQLVSWHLANASDGDAILLRGAVTQQVLLLVSRIGDLALVSASMDDMTFMACWFAVELSARIGCRLTKQGSGSVMQANPLVASLTLLVQHLMEYGLQQTMEPIRAYEEGLDTSTTSQRTAELWVCCLHLVNTYRSTDDQDVANVHPVWQAVLEAIQSKDSSGKSNLDTSESIWRTIFSLCTLSQFSIHGMTTSTSRLPASWELVAYALRQIRLVGDLSHDQSLSEKSLDKRDEYIGLIASRCFYLWYRWHWGLDGVHVVLNQLAEIFRSRKFANLRHESADFPGFMLHHDLGVLHQDNHADTAFVLFLKLIVQAKKAEQPSGEDNARGLSSKVKKLLSLAIPVGFLPFSKKTPPSLHDLSMLYNRFSAVAVAIYLDPQNLRSRISHARAYINFKEADDTTRVACIRGMMYIAILMVHSQQPLDEVLHWLGDMVSSLMEDFAFHTLEHQKEMGKDEEQHSVVIRDRVVFSIQILLGAVRRIFEEYLTNPQPSQQQRYPDPAILSRVTRILCNTQLGNVDKTAMEMQRLIQTFLNVRAAVMPSPQRPRLPDEVPENNQESQDEYGTFDLDLDDPELLAALGEDVQSPVVIENRAKDKLACETIDKLIYPVVYRLLCKCFHDPPRTTLEEWSRNADIWIDCWLGCASVVVQNGKKNWSAYLDRRADSWGRIADESWRRRIDARVMLTLLRLDPMTYESYKDRFIEVLLESMVPANVTIEHEYLSFLLSVDGLQHPLLRNVPCQLAPGQTDYEVTKAEFQNIRLPVIGAIFSNLDRILSEEAGNRDMMADSQKYVGFLIKMLSAMSNILEGLEAGSDRHRSYRNWCLQVFEMIHRHPAVKLEARLLYWMTWGRSLQ